MSFRNNLIATSTFWVVAFSGVSSMVSAADTKPIVLETCTQATLASHRFVGHPGKSILLPKREVREVARCSSEQRKPLILASYTDARGGQALVRGRTEQALEQIYAKKSAPSSAAELTNLCVAKTVLRQWSQAGDACDAAVARALDERDSKSTRLSAARKMADKGVGAAYSNRAVMHWMSGDEVAAHNDLLKAQDLSPDASYVMRNLKVAERKPSLVRATADQSSIG
jgi:hypothetical protein